MTSPRSSIFRARPSLAFILLVGLLITVCLAGGASRGEVLGQLVVRSVSWLVVVVVLLAVPRPLRVNWPIVPALLLASVVLGLVQLIPLPPAAWQVLPGRSIWVDAAAATGQTQPWRHWSIVPGATVNAVSSLVVPFAVWLLVSNLRDGERRWLPGLVLGIATILTFLGLLQFSGVIMNNPFVNDTPGDVVGTFANRNHFALFLAVACLIAPVWGFLGGQNSHWRSPIAWGLVLLFLLTILASGSRAGLGLGLLALLIGLALSWEAMRKMLARYPRWVFHAVVASIIGVIAVFVLFSILADRAVSINRLFTVDVGQDMRGKGLPIVLHMIREYFPFGTGLGSFDPMFRLHEPITLLKPTYFNHAHNDFLEVVLDAGLPAALLLLVSLGWWAWASMRAWQERSSRRHVLSRLGSAILFLVMLASIVDYPARTPMIMAIAVIAAVWLSDHSQGPDASALPRSA